ncbi:MAG: uroporphyrinogen-III C-methyltransferase [Thermodesulfobacteriota bacterium]
MDKGKVYLVGAGPGDPGLITLKAVELLGKADAVVYDFLANPALLAHVSPSAELIYVGKKGGDHTLAQREINRLMVDLAGRGKSVVRLKGGDPFVFGRGGEEAEELAAAGVPFEVVPGVSSAVAAPAYAGIPVTHRRFTSNVGFITGHEDPDKPESALDWSKIATAFGTLVFLMGVRNLPGLTSNLVQGGRDPATPAALVQWGTTPDQRTVVGRLDDIAEKARTLGIKPPAVLVVGGVVALRETLNWYETLPLFGRRLLVTRTREQAGALAAGLTALGADVIECPTIRLAPPEDWSPVDRALENLADFHWLVLTSPNGVDFFFHRLREKGRDARALGGLKVAAIGPATADKLEAYGLRADLVPAEYVAEGLAAALAAAGVAARRVLLARAAEARDVLPRELAAAGAVVTEVPLYRALPPDSLTSAAEQALDQGRLDLATFTSSSTVTNLMRLLGGRADRFRAEVPAACIGPITAGTAEAAGLRVVVKAPEYTVDGLIKAVARYFSP